MSSGNGDAIAVLRERVERLACDFPIQDNYFAWQAFGRGYDLDSREAVPAYLREENYATLKAGIGNVSVHHASLVDYLKTPAGAVAASLCAAGRPGLDG